MAELTLGFASGESSLEVRRFAVRERMSTLFRIEVLARSPRHDIDLESLVGRPATFRFATGYRFARVSGGARAWSGVCDHAEQVQAETEGLSTYYFTLAPSLWLLTQRRNHRIFQQLSVPQIVDRFLLEWSIRAVWQIERTAYPSLEYRVQYGESDADFVFRLLEEAGIAFHFRDDGDQGSTLVLGDAFHAVEPRDAPPLPAVDNPGRSAEQEYLTRVRLSHDVRPGATTFRDYDFRHPRFELAAAAREGLQAEATLEQLVYLPGASLAETGSEAGTPVADDRGFGRWDPRFLEERAGRAHAGARIDRRSVSYLTNAADLAPGVAFFIGHHPHPSLDESAKLLVTEFAAGGAPGEEWTLSGRAVFAETPYRPPHVTLRPEVRGVQSAVVVGPPNTEIHTDEFGRVRVQFPWDREGQLNEGSSCWIRVSQGWAGAGYGMITLPRIGHEVLVGFLAGNPDQPVVVGRVFNALQAVPYRLPDHKTRSTWKSDSSPGSGGFNEILFEDQRDNELVYEQAQKNLRRLVKNDETITVGRDRQKLVKRNEVETTGRDRVEWTQQNRIEITRANRTLVVGGDRSKLIKGDERERVQGRMLLTVAEDQDLFVKRQRRELVREDCHLVVEGDRREKIQKSMSSIVGGERHQRVDGSWAASVGREIHIKSGTSLVIEAPDVTIKAPGGFVRIDASGVTVKGRVVHINSGGVQPGEGAGASPVEPDEAEECFLEPPDAPIPDDVGETGLKQ